MKPIFLEAAGEDDVAALVDLERRCQTHPWTADHFRAEMSPGRAWVMVLRSRTGIHAYCAIRVVADELHIQNLAVAPEDRGQGWARLLLTAALAFGSRRGARTALLEVRESNAAARGIYEALGFEKVLVRRGYYSNPAEDALVLRREIGGDDKP